VGMYNLGQTCFMSSVLQCLVHCAPLQRFFLRDVGHDHKSCQYLLGAAEDYWDDSDGLTPSAVGGGGGTGSTGEDAATAAARGKMRSKRVGGGGDDDGGKDGVDACLACEMDRLFLEYFGSAAGVDVLSALEEPPLPASRLVEAGGAPRGGCVDRTELGQPIVTQRLLTATWRNAEMKHLAGYEQRDAHEFLQAFLDVLGKHVRRTDAIAKKMSAKSSPSGINARMAGPAKPREKDIVKYLFEGTLRSVLICSKCGYKRSQPEPFMNISLPISKEVARHAKLSVETCLEHFTKPEELVDPVQCPSCEIKTKTRKQHSFAKLPRVLCLHLKRFDAAANKKITDKVHFPAHGLNMGPHLPHWCEVMQGRQMETETPEKSSANSPKVLYDLFATVNHTGTLHQGHYFANVKVGDKWYRCNDAFVAEAGQGDGEKEVLGSEGAYILFYKRR